MLPIVTIFRAHKYLLEANSTDFDVLVVVFQISTGWASATDDIRMTQWSKYMIEHMHTLNKELGIASEFIYMGDAGETQIPWSGFPTKNVEMMRNVSRTYDPDFVFQRLNWGGFKLGY